MGGSSSLWLGSSIGLNPGFQFLPWTKGDDAACGDRDLFPCLGVAARPLAFVAKVEVAETGQLDLLVLFKCVPNFFEKQLDQLLGLSLVEPQLLVQPFGHLSFRQSTHTLFP